MWTEPFEEILRAHLTVSPGAPLLADALLDRLGLDSMGTVMLLVQLEEAYSIVIPDELLEPGTFRTAASLWSVVSGLAGPAVSSGTAHA